MGFLSLIDGALGKLDEWYFRYHHARRQPLPMFYRGWGSDAALDAVNARWHSLAAAHIDIDWEGDWAEVEPRLWVRRGGFPTPAYTEHLPAESSHAYLHFVRPSVQGTGPVVVLMPTSSEAGVHRRMPIARALAKQGISSLLLESPYMGRRKPAGQHETTLAHFSDFVVLSAASVEEGRAVLGWLDRQGFDRLCIAGISKGGYLATVAGLRASVRAHVVALVPPHSGVPVLVDGLLGRLCDWDLLQRTSGSTTPVRQQMVDLFEQTSLERLPPPAPPQRVTLICARHDRYVPSYSYEHMARCWQAHATVRWLPGGHVSSIVERSHLTRAITETIVSARRLATAGGHGLSARIARPD
jgi:hypothetical protein